MESLVIAVLVVIVTLTTAFEIRARFLPDSTRKVRRGEATLELRTWKGLPRKKVLTINDGYYKLDKEEQTAMLNEVLQES